MLHSSAQVWLRSLQQQVDVVWHPAKRQDFPAASRHFILQTACKSFVMPVIVKDLASRFTTRHDMIKSTWEFNARLAWHEEGPAKASVTTNPFILSPRKPKTNLTPAQPPLQQ